MATNTTPIPKNFRTLIADFTRDLSGTFPEYSHMWDKYGNEDTTDDQLEFLFKYCSKVYPARFFDILNQNEDIFKEGSDEDVYFFPNMSFRLIFNSEGLSESSKKIIWKYLQLTLFTVVGTMDDKSSFGDTASMFEGIDQDDLHEKLKDAMSSITSLFANMEQTQNTDNKSNETDGTTNETDGTTNETDGTTNEPEEGSEMPNTDGFKNMFKNMPNMEGIMPDIENLKKNLKSLFDGKIGELAKEMAEDIADDFKDVLGDDVDTTANPQDILKNLMKNPGKISSLMKTVGAKLDSKMKDGSINKEELMAEAGDMMNKMKNMGGSSGTDFQEMFKNMAKSMGGMGKNMKFDKNKLERMTKREEQKQKMLQRAAIRREKELLAKKIELENVKQRIREQNELKMKYSVTETNDPNHLVYKVEGEESQPKSFIHPDIEKLMEEEDREKEQCAADALKNKKKKKKKKAKK